MLRTMSWQQYRLWQAYAALEPFGEERGDYRAASIVQTLQNLNRKKGSPPIKLADCLLQWAGADKKKTRQTWQQQKAIGAMIAAAYGARSKP